ncbi:LysM peptidoglycan-binding domain-containing protein [Streptococcus suis]|nr:LysM peptidoglycan-binding domain-containing protein [Streptococcus suis]
MKFSLKSNLKPILTGAVATISLATTGLVSAETYTVQAGDTLSEIALQYQTSVEALVEENKIADKNLISVGQVLEIGEAEATTQTVTTETSSEATVTTTTSYSSNLSAEDAAAKEWIAQKESGGSYTAQNGIYYGRYQLTNTYLNGDYSPDNQERVADAYVAERYGSWSAAKAFWLANGWY